MGSLRPSPPELLLLELELPEPLLELPELLLLELPEPLLDELVEPVVELEELLLEPLLELPELLLELLDDPESSPESAKPTAMMPSPPLPLPQASNEQIRNPASKSRIFINHSLLASFIASFSSIPIFVTVPPVSDHAVT